MVVRESIAAWCNLPKGKSGSLMATTGVSGEATSSSAENEYNGASKGASVSRYSVKHDAQAFTLSCVPEASASYPDTHIYPVYWGVSSNVAYLLDVAYPKIVLSGGKGNAGGELLIGQRLTAQMPALLDLVAPANGGYSWSVEGNADPFKEFFVRLNYALLDSVGEKRQPSIDDLKKKIFYVSFAKPGTATVKSGTVHFGVPAGALPAAGLDVAFESVSVDVISPDLIQPVTVAKGTVIIDQPTTMPVRAGQIRLGGNNGTTYDKQTGINYRSAITTPSAYVLYGYNGQYMTVDPGGFRWVQVVTYGTSRNVSDGKYQEDESGPAWDNPNLYWKSGLDTGYPYEPTSIYRNTVDAQDGWNLMYYANGGGRDAQGNIIGPGEAGDTPALILNRQDAESGGIGDSAPTVFSYNVRDDFLVYQLYRPPGAGSQFVPVQSFHWYWGGDPAWVGPSNQPNVGGWYFATSPIHKYDSVTPLSSLPFPNYLWSRLMYGSASKYRTKTP